MASSLIYKCPNCGSVLEYDAQQSMMTCEHCSATFTPQQAEAAATQADTFDGEYTFSEQDQQFQETVASYECPSCGAQILTDPNTSATFCTFCGSPVINETRLSGIYRPAQVIPFKITKEQAQESFKNWCKKAHFTPADFQSKQELEKITGIYVPFWLFDCSVEGSLIANGTKVRTWPMGNYMYTNTKRFSIRRRAMMEYDKVPADGSSNMDDQTMDLLEPYDYSNLQPFQMPLLSGYQAEKYDVPPKQVYPRIKERLNQYTEQHLRETVSGYTSVTNLRVQNMYRGTNAVYTLLPVWVHRYRFNGQTYQFSMNGQTGKIIGTPPLSKGKAALSFLLYALGIAAVLFAGGMLLI